MSYKHFTFDNIDFIEDFISTIQHPAQFKDVKTGKYLYSNKFHLQNLGFHSMDQIIGCTLEDIDQLMQPKWGNYASQIKNMELQVLANKEIISARNQAWVKDNGLIWIHNASKIPVMNSNGQVSLIVTITEDITSKKSIRYLYPIYKKLYDDKKIAITKFLEHFSVLKYFMELPSDAELNVLIARINAFGNKEIANLLSISLKTVEAHIYNLKQKIITSLDNVIVNIRNSYIEE
jgi:hypothetical protein